MGLQYRIVGKFGLWISMCDKKKKISERIRWNVMVILMDEHSSMLCSDCKMKVTVFYYDVSG